VLFKSGADIRTNSEVSRVTRLHSQAAGNVRKTPEGFELQLKQNPPHPAGTPPKEGNLKAPLHGRGGRSEATDGVGGITCRKLLVATGGGEFIEGLGHTIEPCVPSLFTFKTSDKEFTALAGIVVEDVHVSAPRLKAEGALLITHGGVSGPAVLSLSSFGARTLAETNYRFDMKINWLPAQSEEQVFQALEKFRAASPRKQVGTWSPVGLSSRLWKLLVARAGVDETREWGSCPIKALRHIAAQVSGFVLPITGKNPHREEFVTCGGIRLKEVNFHPPSQGSGATGIMESRLVPGLYFAGEVLDIDALTGGFNLQAAWTTGYLAAQSIAAGNLS